MSDGVVIGTDKHPAENSSRGASTEEGGENVENLAALIRLDGVYTDANSALNLSSDWWMSERSAAATTMPMGPNRAGPPR
ncbi:hypothetical protein MAUB1S_04823 [Mycolicibacterium aubagnense]